MSANTTVKPKKESFFKKWVPLAILSLALAIILIDVTVLNVSLSTIIKDTNSNIQSIQWVITAYTLTLAALTITGGRMGDIYGRKKMFVLGAILFAIGSFIMSISQNVPQMILGESIIEGIGGALMMPATASLLVSLYRGRDRAVAFGFWGGVAGAATAIGPLLGGYLTTYYSWRWAFRINVFVAALLVIGSIWITECRDIEEAPKLDLTGVFLSSVALLGIVFGIIESTTYGWIKAKEVFLLSGYSLDFHGYSISAVSILVGVIFLIAFFVWESQAEKHTTPLVSLKIFKNYQFTSGMAVTGILALAQAGLIFSIPVFVQAVRGEDAFHTGLALVPMSITAFFVAPLSGFLTHKHIQAKHLIQAGLFFNVAGYWVLRSVLTPTTTNAQLAPGMILLGLGIGLAIAQINNVTLSAVSVQQAGEASGVNNTFRQLGSTLGTALLGAVLLTAISTNIASGIDSSKVIPTQLKGFVKDKVSSQSSNVEFGGGAQLQGFIPPKIKEEITAVSNNAVTEAAKKSLGYAAFIGLIGFGASFFLPGSKDIEKNEDIANKPAASARS